MNHFTAILSTLHDRPGTCGAAERRFRAQPVLWWTLERLSRSQRISAAAIICWEDQLELIQPIAEEHDAYVLAQGPRVALPQMEAITAARRWSDGWRGGLLGTCDFDLGFHAQWTADVLEELQSDAAVLVDGDAGLVDPKLIDDLIAHACQKNDQEFAFMPAAPGLSGTLIRPSLLKRLAASTQHPGRLLSYQPQQPTRDPIASESCAPTPTRVARTTHRFKLDSQRQIQRLSDATISLNGQLVRSEAEELLNRVVAHQAVDRLPREVVLELTTRRSTRPIYSPASSPDFKRDNLSLEIADRLFQELSALDDIRLTLAGVGDPLLHPEFHEIVEAARRWNIHALHVETDLYGVSHEAVERLAELPIDVISVHLPAATPATYVNVMGIDGMAEVIRNIETLVTRRQQLGRGTPLVVPTFTKCKANLAEMEVWYDQWLRVLGSAVIIGPTTCAGLIDDVSVADMRPPMRRACARLSSRMTVLCDGSIVSCEQDVLGKQVMGRIGHDVVSDVWTKQFAFLRADHEDGRWDDRPTCRNCEEWHRP